MLDDQRLRVRELQDHYRRGDDVIAVHYGCENLYAATDHLASVSCIALCRVGGRESESFSVVDVPSSTDPISAEIAVLQKFFQYLKEHPSALYVHWNMSRPDYGFGALETRFESIASDSPLYKVPRDRAYDLDQLVGWQFGQMFAPHPRLISLATLNGLSRHHALGGKEEADRFDAGDHGAVRRSVGEKVQWIADLADRFLTGRLQTAGSVGSIKFVGEPLDAVRVVVELGRRMLYVERELARRHGRRRTIVVRDEYDSQDLIRSLLRIFFDDIRPEDYVPSYAGGASRIDFVLPEVKLAIELKHTRPSLDAKSLGEELLVDIARYGHRADVRHLVCLVFDTDGRLANPRGLEADLSQGTTKEGAEEGVAVTVVIIDR